MHSNGHHLFFKLCFVIFAFLSHSSNAIPLLKPETLQCVPTTWQDIFVFFLTTYLAHAATVPSPPGKGWLGTFQWSVVALLYPFFGLGRAASIILNHCAFGEDELGRAFSAGALAVVARTGAWKPPTKYGETLICNHVPSQFIEDAGPPKAEQLDPHLLLLKETEAEEGLSPTAAVFVEEPLSRQDGYEESLVRNVDDDNNIHGNHTLPDGYRWVIPSPTLCFGLVQGLKDRRDTKVAQSRSLLKMVISICQLFLSSITIYRTRGSQLDRYGYAAFGLSAFPYAFMSFVNLISVGCMGDYPYLFMLQTPSLLEAKGRPGALISGEVGILQTAHGSQKDRDQSGDAARLGPDEEEELLSGGVIDGVDEQIHACLWTEDSRKLLCMKIGDSKTKRFKLVDNPEGATFVFHVHPFKNRLLIYEQNVKSKGTYWSTPEVNLISRLRKRFQQTEDANYQDRIGLVFNASIALTSPFLALVLPYLLIFSLTGFRKQESTTFERLAMISWIVNSQLVMVYSFFFLDFPNASLDQNLDRPTNPDTGPETVRSSFWVTFLSYVIAIIGVAVLYGIIAVVYFAPPVSGFVAVAKMLKEFGSCSLS